MAEVSIAPKEAPPVPPPGVSTLPEAPVPDTVFRDVGRDTPLEQLRSNFEETIKIAGQPVDKSWEAWERVWQLVDDVDTTKLDLINFHREVRREAANVRMYMGEIKAYRSTMAQAFIALQQEEKRGNR